MDMELVDGYEDLPQEAQVKVKRALEQGHVDDEDWNGVSHVHLQPHDVRTDIFLQDAEMNRYNSDHPMQGMFVKVSAKKKKKVIFTIKGPSMLPR